MIALSTSTALLKHTDIVPGTVLGQLEVRIRSPDPSTKFVFKL